MSYYRCSICLENLFMDCPISPASTHTNARKQNMTTETENNNIAATPCGHVFHDTCLQACIHSRREQSLDFQCPNCKHLSRGNKVKRRLYFSESHDVSNSVKDVLHRSTRNKVKVSPKKSLIWNLHVKFRQAKLDTEKKRKNLKAAEMCNKQLLRRAATAESKLRELRTERNFVITKYKKIYRRYDIVILKNIKLEEKIAQLNANLKAMTMTMSKKSANEFPNANRRSLRIKTVNETKCKNN